MSPKNAGGDNFFHRPRSLEKQSELLLDLAVCKPTVCELKASQQDQQEAAISEVILDLHENTKHINSQTPSIVSSSNIHNSVPHDGYRL